jgi:hypothetical protein
VSGKGRLRAGLLLVSAFLSVPNAGSGCDNPVEVSLGQTFTLGLGKRAAIPSEKVVIRFVAVPEDSRCPKGEQCIVAGKARVALEISVEGGTPAEVELGTSEGYGETDVAGFQVTLVGLAPYPVSGKQILNEEYVATLILRRL